MPGEVQEWVVECESSDRHMDALLRIAKTREADRSARIKVKKLGLRPPSVRIKGRGQRVAWRKYRGISGVKEVRPLEGRPERVVLLSDLERTTCRVLLGK